MKYEIVMLKEKRVVGFCQRTGNDKEDMGNVIGGLWQKWSQVNEKIKSILDYIQIM